MHIARRRSFALPALAAAALIVSTLLSPATAHAAPNTPAVSSTDYPTGGFNGSPGRTGIFTFSPNGSTDVVRYGWSLNVDTYANQVDVTQPDGVVNVPITPARSGPNSLYVQAYDSAGNRAATPATYIFMVADLSRPVAAWNFDETGGTTAADTTGNGHTLTLNGATFGPGYANNGQVNTSNSFSATESAVLDTSRAFSVSAWVTLDNADSSYTVASQDGGFSLQYSKTADRWTFGAASSEASPQLGVWTHLLATYEPNSMSLYVNGKLEGTADATLAAASGQFVVGSAGTIDHVQVWDRALSDEEAVKHNNFVVLRARYNLDERTGTTTRDEVSGLHGTVSGGTTWASTPVDPDNPDQMWKSEDKWLRFDSSRTGLVTGPRPANLRTDRSFMVAVWVRHKGPGDAEGTAVGMTDAPFTLGYRPETGKWGFQLGGATLHSNHSVEPNKWVHLAATFDATTGTVALYVHGAKQVETQIGLQSLNGTGDFLIGSGWTGDVDDARIYSGLFSSAQQMTALRLTNMHS